jgi:predicted transcriptional regulator of viral defense system
MSDKQKTDLPSLHRLAYSQDGLFTTRQAQERGVSAQLLAHHARSGRFQRVRHGLYRLSDYPAGEHEEIRAAWLTVGMKRAVVSHESALVLHGLSDVIPNTVHLLCLATRQYADRLSPIQSTWRP